MSGWGSGSEGTSRWGVGDDLAVSDGPIIDPIDPVENASGVARTRPLTVRLKDDVGIDSATIFVSIDGVQYVRGGVVVNGATYTATANSFNGFDLVVTPPTAYDSGAKPEVQISVTNGLGQTSVLVYRFTVGVGPRLLGVKNPSPGILLADFNQSMMVDNTFRDIGNWQVEGVSADALPLTITKVSSTTLAPNRATLEYEGGGSTYELVVVNIVSKDGESLEFGFDRVQFELTFGAEDVPVVRLFDSVFGPLGISQREVRRHDVDRHAANRSLAVALDEQVRLKFQQLDATAGRDGRPGATRRT